MKLGIMLMLVGNWMLAGAVVYEMRRAKETRRRVLCGAEAATVA